MSLNIEYIEKIVPDAYHGTSKENAERIKREGFKISVGADQYLGNGVYFFESSLASAIQWAERDFAPSERAVFKAIVNLGVCLDFHNPEHAAFVVEAKESFAIRQAALPEDDPQKAIVVTDALVINGLAELVQIDTVRASYIHVRARKMFSGSRFFAPQQLFICVRNLDRILDLKVV